MKGEKNGAEPAPDPSEIVFFRLNETQSAVEWDADDNCLQQHQPQAIMRNEWMEAEKEFSEWILFGSSGILVFATMLQRGHWAMGKQRNMRINKWMLCILQIYTALHYSSLHFCFLISFFLDSFSTLS